MNTSPLLGFGYISTDKFSLSVLIGFADYITGGYRSGLCQTKKPYLVWFYRRRWPMLINQKVYRQEIGLFYCQIKLNDLSFKIF